MDKIYLDHGATTPMKEDVLEAMLPYLKGHFGNPSSIHAFGRESRKGLDEARSKVAASLGAQPEEIIFTSGGTESDNLAIQGAARALENKGRHIITSAIEHHAVLDTVMYLGKKGFDVTILPVDQYGMVDPQDLQNAITANTILVSIMTANNEIGTIQPIEELGRICRDKEVYFHTDAVQSIGHMDFQLQDQPIDMLSLSAHKFYGPKGVGALYIRKKTRLEQLVFGGGQERKLRPGTEFLPGIVGLSRAIELASEDIEGKKQKLIKLRDKLIAGLLEIDDVLLNGHPSQRLPGNVNVSALYVEGESLLLSLDIKGIAASSGSACTSGSLDPSHVLMAIGLDHQTAHGSLRLSLGESNTEEQVEYVVDVYKETVSRLRKMSSVFKK